MKKIILSALVFAGAVLSADAQLLITQYYEGTGTNKWIEVTNVGGSAIDFSSASFTLALYSNANREAWKTGGSATASLLLNTGSLASGASFVFGNTGNSTPSYAVANLNSNTVINFNGDDSIVLFSGNSTAFANVADAFGLTGNTAADTSFTRIGPLVGTNADFNAALWSNIGLTGANSAAAGTDARIGFYAVPEPATSVTLLGGLGAMLWTIRRRRVV